MKTTIAMLHACLRQTRPRLPFLLKQLFSEARLFGHDGLWLGDVIALLLPLGFQERAIRMALLRLAEHKALHVERHGRRNRYRLEPATAALLQAAQQRLNRPPGRSFDEDWTLLINSGGLGAVRYAAARKHLLTLDYCQLAPNVLARPAAYGAAHPPGMPAAEQAGLARFEVSGAQLAAAVHQPLFGPTCCDLSAAAGHYAQFLQRFAPLRALLQRHPLSDAEAFSLRLLVSHGYQHCRRSDPLLPQELLPADWPATAAHQTYMALYAGCAAQAMRHLRTISAAQARRRQSAPINANHKPPLERQRRGQEQAA